MTKEATFNDAIAEAFAEKMLNAINGAALVLMTSVGHRTGLFDTMAQMPPATSKRIAEVGGLEERYVREWLGSMVTARVVEYDPATATYYLPREHAASLTRAASPNNMAVTTQFISVLGAVESEVVNSFHVGGGVPYASFDRFHEVMAEESAQTTCAGLFDHILPLAPEALAALEEGIEVLDVGCGQGRAITLLAERFPRSRFTGYDLSEEATGAANAEAKRRGLDNLVFEVKDVATVDAPDRFGLITAFDAIHDQAHPATVLAGIYRSLAPGGTFLMQDIAGSSHLERNLDHVLGPFTYAISCMHCMTVSLAQGGEGLGAMWGREKALEMLGEAGFVEVEEHSLPHDIINLYYIARKR